MTTKALSTSRGGGSKKRHLKKLYKLFPPIDSWKTIIEPFVFTFAVILNLPIYNLRFRDRKIINVNDIDTTTIDLAYLYLLHPDKLYQAQISCIKNQGFAKFLQKGFKPQNIWERGLKRWYLMFTMFSSKQDSQSMGYRINEYRSHYPVKEYKIVREINVRLQEMAIFNEDFRPFLSRFTNGRTKKGFIYADPPYVSAAGTGIYEHSFNEQDHRELGALLQNFSDHGGYVCISYDQHKLIDEIYADWNFHELELRYSMAGCDDEGRRQGGKQIEYVITNYKVKKQQTLPRWLNHANK